MDTPKRQVSWLENFLPDIWAYIVWYLSGEQVLRLMMTGATLLRQRLKSPHVVKSIKLGDDFIIFKSFPKFLNDFPSLVELDFRRRVDEGSNKLGIQLDSIPSGVRKLWLREDEKESADKLFGKDGVTLKLNEHLPRLEYLEFFNLYFPIETWMTYAPSSLTYLIIDRWDGTVELPSSLIHFKARSVELETSSFVAKLPPSLESFEVTFLCGLELLVPLLPPSTRKLYIDSPGYSDGPISSQNFLEQLPKSLTWLDVPYLEELDFEAEPRLISLLSSTLVELCINLFLPCSVWSLLPQQIRKLSFQYEEFVGTEPCKTSDSLGQQSELRTLPFDSLPRSLTSLLLSVQNGFFCGRTSFPPQLTELRIHKIQLAPDAVKLLPSTLTVLMIGNLCERVCEHLPSGLQTLVSSSALITPNLIKFLPKSLTSLQLHVAQSDSRRHWFDYNTGQTIESISELPEYSIQERCMSYSFDWKDHSRLPSTLTQLTIQRAPVEL